MTERRIIYRVHVVDEKLLLKRARKIDSEVQDVEDALLACMTSGKAPLDCGFEIMNQEVYKWPK